MKTILLGRFRSASNDGLKSASENCRLQHSSCDLESWLLLEDPDPSPVALHDRAIQMFRRDPVARALCGGECCLALLCRSACPTVQTPDLQHAAMHGMQGSNDVSAEVAAVILQTHLSTQYSRLEVAS